MKKKNRLLDGRKMAEGKDIDRELEKRKKHAITYELLINHHTCRQN